jgi:hypothetical protein
MFCVTDNHVVELYLWTFCLHFLILKGYCYCFVFINNLFFSNHSASLFIVSFIFFWTSLALFPVINMLVLSEKNFGQPGSVLPSRSLKYSKCNTGPRTGMGYMVPYSRRWHNLF